MNMNIETKLETIKSRISLINGWTCYVFDSGGLLRLKPNESAQDLLKIKGEGDEN